MRLEKAGDGVSPSAEVGVNLLGRFIALIDVGVQTFRLG